MERATGLDRSLHRLPALMLDDFSQITPELIRQVREHYQKMERERERVRKKEGERDREIKRDKEKERENVIVEMYGEAEAEAESHEQRVTKV